MREGGRAGCGQQHSNAESVRFEIIEVVAWRPAGDEAAGEKVRKTTVTRYGLCSLSHSPTFNFNTYRPAGTLVGNLR